MEVSLRKEIIEPPILLMMNSTAAVEEDQNNISVTNKDSEEVVLSYKNFYITTAGEGDAKFLNSYRIHTEWREFDIMKVNFTAVPPIIYENWPGKYSPDFQRNAIDLIIERGKKEDRSFKLLILRNMIGQAEWQCIAGKGNGIMRERILRSLLVK